ncbi:hypothetical protein FRC06_002718 [Ceratobasidium sp. 370]|nr:hypothetical protein FRC06_002718 [Ceratobasidium sp. 370]
MASLRTRGGEETLVLDHTMREDAAAGSGDESDVMDNIMFRRPVTRGSSRAAATLPVASSSAQPARRRSPRKSNPMSPPKRPSRPRRVSQTMSSPSSSPSQPSQSQSDPPANDESTGVSQEMARVSVAVDLRPELTDAPMDNTEPPSGDAVSAPGSMNMDTHQDTSNASDPLPTTLDAPSSSAPGPSKARAVVFETEPVLGSDHGLQQAKREPKPSARTPLALPIFSVTSSPGGTEEEPLVVPAPESLIIDSSLSVGNKSSGCDVSIPTSLAPPMRAHTPRRSPRLSGTTTVDVSSSSPPHTTSNISISSRPRQTKKAKAPAGPSTASDAPIVTTSKGKEKERVSSPPLIPTTTKTDIFKPLQLRSLSPDSDAVLTSLHRTMSPQPRLKLLFSAERPPPVSSAIKRQAEEADSSSPGKRARFDPDPQPPPTPPKPNLARPGRIRVHPAGSLQASSFLGAHPPIVVRPASSPSRQQLLMQRPPGPPIRVLASQQQRVVFAPRVPSPIRTGSHHGVASKNPSPVKTQRNGGTLVWQRAAPVPMVPNRDSQLTNQIKAEVLIAPRDDAPRDGSAPGRADRSRLPVPKAASGVPRATERKREENRPGVPPAGVAVAEGSPTLQVPLTVPRERTPPTPLETPASPGSSSSTLIMDVPLFYQPPTPRLPPIQQRTAEEIIAQGVEREAQRKRERQGQAKAAATAAAALRCVPLARARQIIPDRLQSWASTSGLSESQKEVERLTRENTERNTVYACTLEMTEAFRDAPRPPSPTSRIRTKAQKAKEVERQERAERAQRRSASRGDTLVETPEPRPVLAPGDDEVWESSERPGHVRWAQRLVNDDTGAVPSAKPAAGAGRGCLKQTYSLDGHGNALGDSEAGGSERVVVVRYLYKK